MYIDNKIAVVIPCFKVRNKILEVISSIDDIVDSIYVIDDFCPQKTGEYVKNNCSDARVAVIFNEMNMGVGGAVMAGYKAAVEDKSDIIVKLDGDGQMDGGLIINFISPIQRGDADYSKGNRFFNVEDVRQMPKIRLFGNAALSFITKISSGYWDVFDPTNGFTAIHRNVAKMLPYEKISKRYFFETDMLFRLNIMRCVVIDIPMIAKYDDEVSNLKVKSIFFEFLFKNIRNFWKRVFYNYYLRDMSAASIELPIGILLMAFGVIFGISKWAESSIAGVPTTPGAVMIVGICLISGLQLILSFLSYDIESVPKKAIHRYQ